jgi:hypothetical protein
MRQLTGNESYRAIDWMRQARLCLESALALLRLDPGAMPFAYQTRYISADVNRLCERIEPSEQPRPVKAEAIGTGAGEIAIEAGGFFVASECFFGPGRETHQDHRATRSRRGRTPRVRTTAGRKAKAT